MIKNLYVAIMSQRGKLIWKDTHRGIYNLTVKNSTIGEHGLTQIGFRNLTIKDVKIKHTNKAEK